MTDRFKEIREKIFKTQTEMATALGVTRQAISSIEQGKTKPSYDLLFLLINQYNINLNYLIDGKGSPLLNDNDIINKDEELTRLKEKVNALDVEKKLLKELLKK